MDLPNIQARSLRHPVMVGWLVHCVTALGAVCGMFGLIAVADGEPKEAILWLAVAMVLDGIDGPAARAWGVRDHVPRIDGYTLDLIVDFVTCVVIPVLFLHRFGMLPEGWSLTIGAFMLFTSALWMARTDQMTDDLFFNGFPGAWNLVVPTLFLLPVPQWFTGVACIGLSLAQLTSWKFVHPMQVRTFRPVNIAVTVIWLALILLMTYDLPSQNAAGEYLLAACVLYVAGLTVWRTIGPGAVGQETDTDDIPHPIVA